jgi:sporulation protein YlmC with PRC-barrel domain
MNKITKMIVLVFMFSFVLMGSGAFAQMDSETSVFSYQPMSWNTFDASWLIGLRVLDNGQINDLVIDQTNGRIALVMLSDVPGLAAQPLAVPYSSLLRTGEYTFELRDSNPFVIVSPSDSHGYGGSPETDPTWISNIYTYYHEAPYWTENGEKPLHAGKIDEYTKIIGTEVQSRGGEVAGKINDFMIDSSDGHVAFLILSDVPGRGDRLAAVPFGSLERNDKNAFVLNVDKEKLVSAPSFNESEIGDRKHAEGVYRFFGFRPYWEE